MKVIIFGATGMVGQGVLRECEKAPNVTSILTPVRKATGNVSPKVRELVVPDMADITSHAAALAGYDACFYCLGVSIAGLDEATYRRITYDYAIAAANILADNKNFTFVYVSGEGADANSRTIWARIKGEAENAVLALPFKGVIIRPGFIRPGPGIKSRTGWYNVIYAFIRPLYPLIKLLAGTHVTTNEAVGRAMITIASRGAPKSILMSPDINAIADASAT